MTDVTGAYLGYQVHPGHAALADDVIGWYDTVAAGLERRVMPQAADEFALKRWAAHGYQTDPASLRLFVGFASPQQLPVTDVHPRGPGWLAADRLPAPSADHLGRMSRLILVNLTNGYSSGSPSSMAHSKT